MKPVTCGWESVRSISRSLPRLVTVARMWMSLGAMAVVVEHRLALVDAILPAGDDGAHLALGAVEHRLDRRVRSSPSRTRPSSCPSRRSPMRAEPIIAARSPRKSRGWRTLSTIISSTSSRRPPCVVEPQRRDADAFLPDLGRAGVVGAVRGAADVALMRAVDRPEHQPVAGEHRHEGGQVGQMVAAVIGVVEQIDVARPDVAPKNSCTAFAANGQRADMDRHVLGLGDQPAVGVADRGREIAARVEDLRVGGAQHRLAHLLDDGAQAMLDHRDGDRIDGGVHEMMRSKGGVPYPAFERDTENAMRCCCRSMRAARRPQPGQPAAMNGPRRAQNSSTAPTKLSHSASPIGRLIAIIPRRAM